MSLKQLRVLDKFAKELEEFAKTTEGPGKVLELVPTPTPSEAHASVRTVQELLPYREQFQQAGLAVTSADQKSPHKREKRLPPQPDSSADGRLRFDGGGASTQSTSTTTKGSSSDTAVQLSEPDPLTPTLPGGPSRNNTNTGLPNPTSPVSPTPGSLPSTSSAEVNSAVVVERKTSRARPSAVFLMNKPLPARPGSFGPKPPERKRVSTKEAPSVGQTVATRKAFLAPRPERDLPQIPVKGPSTNIIPHRQMSFQTTKDLIETRRSDKALPALPVARLPSQIRNGLGFAGQPSWAPAARQLPTTIVEEKEPSPEKQKTLVSRTFPLRPKDNNTIVVAKAVRKENSDTQADAKVVTPDLSSKPEPLPETWKHVIGTPSSFKKALDDVVRKLEDMEDNKSATAEAAKPPAQPRRTAPSSSKVPSPSRRLERVAAMRRQRMAEAGDAGPSVEPVERLKPPVPAVVRSSSRPIVRSRSSSRKAGAGAKTQSEDENLPPPAHDDKDISDRDVLKGLKIICAASADHDFDAWIQSKTGLRLRRFLADLKTFENLTEDGILAVGDQRARRRRSERRRRQAERERAR